MTASPAFEIDIRTLYSRSILRAPSEREAALKAESLIRKVHARGELAGFRIEGPDAAATGRLSEYLEGVMAEVERLSV
jgi:hypothetical protein